jgi:pimeloyl-ACP methyl ester carboxylesterase
MMVRWDLPGFGLADRLDLSRGDLRVRAVSFLEAALDGLGLARPVLVANSMGALWTFWLAIDRPERVAAIVSLGCPALLLGTSAPLPMRLMAVRRLGQLMLRLQPPSARQVERALRRIGTDLSSLPELRDLVVTRERLPQTETAWLDLLGTALGPTGSRAEVALTDEQLTGVAQPTQLIWGTDDPFGPPTVGRQAAELLADAELHVVPGGHHPFLPDAEGIAETIREFIHRHAGRTARRARSRHPS